jgi:rare lipoprotein A
MRPRYAAGVGASALIPVLFAYGCGTDSTTYAFDLTAGEKPVTGATWLDRSRVVEEAPGVLAAPAPALAAAAVPPSTTVVAARGSTTTAPPPSTTTTMGSRASTTTAPPAPLVTPTTIRPPGVVVTLPVTLPPILTPVAPAAKPIGGAKQTEAGMASWFNWDDATCAHRTIPFGTIIKVTRVSTGVWTTCEVADWGPADTTRVIDLSMDTFEQLANPEAGLIDVVIEW